MQKLKNGVPGEGQDLSDEGCLTSQSWSSEELCLHLCIFICTVALSLAFSFCLLQPTDLELKPKWWISCGMFKSSVEGVSDLLEVSFLPYWLNIWFVLFYCGNPVPSTVLTSVTFQHHQHCKICYTLAGGEQSPPVWFLLGGRVSSGDPWLYICILRTGPESNWDRQCPGSLAGTQLLCHTCCQDRN